MLVLTVASEVSKAEHLVRSCRKFGVEPVVAGQHLPYVNHMSKFHFTIQTLLTLGGTDDLVLYMDGYDCVLVRTLADVETLYRQVADGRWFFSTEPDCWPHRHLADLYPQPPGGQKSRYLNAGVWVCPGSRVLGDMLRWLREYPDEQHDQGLYTRAFLDHPSEFVLDYDCRLCLNLNLCEPELRTALPYCLETRTYPCVVHGCGVHKDYIPKVTSRLGM